MFASDSEKGLEVAETGNRVFFLCGNVPKRRQDIKSNGFKVYPGNKIMFTVLAKIPICQCVSKEQTVGEQEAIMDSVNKNGQHLWTGIANRDSFPFFWDPGKLPRFLCDPRTEDNKIITKMEFPISLVEVCSELDLIWNKIYNLCFSYKAL